MISLYLRVVELYIVLDCMKVFHYWKTAIFSYHPPFGLVFPFWRAALSTLIMALAPVLNLWIQTCIQHLCFCTVINHLITLHYWCLNYFNYLHAMAITSGNTNTAFMVSVK